jgi:hypothetical protein
MFLKRKENGEDLTSRWGIGKFYSSSWLLDSGLKIIRDKIVRMKSGLMLKKEKM